METFLSVWWLVSRFQIKRKYWTLISTSDCFMPEYNEHTRLVSKAVSMVQISASVPQCYNQSVRKTSQAFPIVWDLGASHSAESKGSHFNVSEWGDLNESWRQHTPLFHLSQINPETSLGSESSQGCMCNDLLSTMLAKLLFFFSF